jgi:hypothetical protein
VVVTDSDETPQPSLLRSLRALQSQAEALVAESREFETAFAALVKAPTSSTVVVKLDDDGLIGSIEIDAAALADATPDAIISEINVAIATANTAAPSTFTAVSLSDLTAALDSGSSLDPVRLPNDLRTVTAVAIWGTVTAVECDSAWIRQTPLALVAEEVVRVSRLAAVASDRWGNQTNKGENR